MANTSNIGLAKLDGTEKLKTFPSTFNSDMDTIDTVVGNDVGTSRTISQAITKTEEGIAIVANGNTHSAISSGQYVYVKNHGSLAEGLYIASSAISANATLSGSNLTAVSGGGLNSVYSALNGKIGQIFYCEHINCTPSASIAAGATGYFTVPVTYAKGKNIISTSIGLGHPGVAGGYSLNGMYANTQNMIYVSYYSPKAITAANADFTVDIVYTDVAMGWNSHSETV